MKKIMAMALVSVGLLAACGVDREGTRDNIIKSFEDQGLAIDKECVDGVLDEYSDDELESMDDELEKNPTDPSAEALEFANKVIACADLPTS